MVGHFIPPFRVLLLPGGFFVEVGCEECHGHEPSGGRRVLTEEGALAFREPAHEMKASHECLLHPPLVEFCAAPVLYENAGWKVRYELLLVKEGVVDDL